MSAAGAEERAALAVLKALSRNWPGPGQRCSRCHAACRLGCRLECRTGFDTSPYTRSDRAQ